MLRTSLPGPSGAAMSKFGGLVRRTTGLQLRSGLRALGANSRKVEPARTRSVLGSADIDSDLSASHRKESRWDYVVGYNGRSGEHAYFIEVHPAHTSNVKEVMRKKAWLVGWLAGVPLAMLTSRSFHWIASGKVRIPANTPQYRQLAKSGVEGPRTRLRLQ